MARASRHISPEKRRGAEEESGEDESDVESEQAESSADNEANDGKLSHLGSDVADIPPGFGETQSSPFRAPVADMGTPNSKEALPGALRAASQELLNRNGAETTGHRKSDGKLKRPSTGVNNPAYRNPVTTAGATQRRLPPSNHIRKSVYDELEDSPAKLPPPKVRRTKQQPTVSPRRGERRKVQQASSPVVEKPHEHSSPRRSRTVQESKELKIPAKPTTPSSAKKRSQAVQQNTSVQISAEDATFKDYIPQPIAQNYQDEDPEAGAAEDEEGDNIEVAEADSTTTNIYNHSASTPKKRGRPRKSTKRGGSVEPHEPADPSEEATPRKTKGGRPRKVKTGGRPSTLREPKGVGEGLRQSTSNGAGHGEAVPSEAVEERAGPQTRAQQASSASPERPRSTRFPFKEAREAKARAEAEATKEAKALENLRRRRTQDAKDEGEARDEDDGQGQPDDGDAEAESPNQDLYAPEEDVNRSPQRPIVSRQPRNLRISEVAFPEGQANDIATVGSEDEQPVRPSKRKSNQSAQPNIRGKRQRFGNTEEESVVPDASTSAGPGQHRLCGQWRQLQAVFKNVELVGCRVEGGVVQEKQHIRLKDKDVKATITLCQKAIDRYGKLRDRSGQIEAREDAVAVLNEIADRVDGLRGLNPEFPTDLEDTMKSTNIYAHLVPKLVELLKSAIACYEAIDAGDAAEGHITTDHLRTVNTLIKLILDLERAAKGYKRPDSNLRVIQPVHNGIAVPLHTIHMVFARSIQDHEYRLQEQKRKEEEAAETALRLEQEERQSRQKAHLHQLRKKWQKLHEERMWAEGGIMSRRKREHLQLPDDNIVEVDHNGLPFERVEAFLPRIGPPPGLVDEATAREWSMVELSSLCEGLKQYTGPNVFERIFRKYCPQGRELNRYNVTEIVTVAAGLKEKLVERQRRGYGDVEEWVLGIPVWTRGHQARGKENEDGAGVVVDLTVEG